MNVRQKMKRIRKSIIYGAAIIAASFCVLISFQLMNGATLVVRNNTNGPMKGVTVILNGYGTSGDLGDIPPGGQLRAKFKNYGNGSWAVSVKDHGGKHLYRQQDSYVTNGLNYFDRSTLEASGEWEFQSISWSLIPPFSAFLP